MRNNILTITFIISLTLFFTGCGIDENKDTTYSVGGMMNGLSGAVVLQNNGKNDLRVTSNGTFTFTTSFADDSTYEVTVLTQPTGQTCSVANKSGTISGTNVIDVVVSCYNSGRLDPTFDNDGVVTHDSAAGGNRNDSGNSITIDSFGRILVTGYSHNGDDLDMVVWRYNNNGNLDTNFGNGGIVVHDSASGGNSNDSGNSITIDSNDRILVTGNSNSDTDSDMVIWRYDTDGNLDASFGNGGIVVHNSTAGEDRNDRGYSITLDSIGRVLVTGESDNDVDSDMAIWRYNDNGAPDSTFGTDGIVLHDNAAGGNRHDRGNSITIDLSGKILVTGGSMNLGYWSWNIVIWRYNSNGTLDTTFGKDGIVSHDDMSGFYDNGNSITIDSNGRILMSGRKDTSPSNSDMVIWRVIQ